jgi:hypothetical protein
MSHSDFDPPRAVDTAPHKSIVAAWAVALILLSAGELFVSFHARIERPLTDIAAVPTQRAAVEDALAR